MSEITTQTEQQEVYVKLVKIFSVSLIFGAIVETVEILHQADPGEGASTAITAFICIFVPLVIWDIIRDWLKEKAERAELRFNLRLRNTLIVRRSIPQHWTIGDIFGVLKEYVRHRYPSESGFKLRQVRKDSTWAIIVRQTLLSRLKFQLVDQSGDIEKSRLARIVITTRSPKLLVSIGLTAGVVSSVFLLRLEKNLPDDVGGVLLAFAGLVLGSLLFGYLCAWTSIRRWFPRDDLISLQDDIETLLVKAAAVDVTAPIKHQIEDIQRLAETLSVTHAERATRWCWSRVVTALVRISLAGLLLFLGARVLLVQWRLAHRTIADARSAIDLKDYSTADEILSPMAEKGNVEARLLLGKMLAAHCRSCDERVKKLLTPSAENGDPESQFLLGTVADHNADTAEAYKWYGEAANRGHPRAQYRLAKLYVRDGPEINAIPLLERSSEAGLRDAQTWLGILSAGWHGVPTDTKKAIHFYTLAANSGDNAAQIDLANVYKKRQQLVDASYWLRICDLSKPDIGDQENEWQHAVEYHASCKEDAEEVEAKLSPRQREELEDRVQQWIKTHSK